MPIDTIVRITAEVLLVVAGGVVAAYCLYLAVLALAARLRPRRSEPPAGWEPRTRAAVVVPAFNEAGSIAACVTALRAQQFPADRYDVVVVADNCTDDTAAIAAAAGARVLTRTCPDRRGKGNALQFAFDSLLARRPPIDAIAVVDADSVAEPDLLLRLAFALEGGAPVAQGESLLRFGDHEHDATLRAVAFLLVNRVRAAGRAALGLPSNLQGNGMLFRRDVLIAHPWDAFSCTEDLEYGIHLRRAGVAPVFAPGATVRSAVAPTARGADRQRLRWLRGQYTLTRAWLPRLLRGAVKERRLDLLDLAFDLALPPFALLVAMALAGALAASVAVLTGLLPPWVVAPWLLAVVGIPVYVIAGMRAADAPPVAYRALLHAPVFVVAKCVHLVDLRRTRADVWERGERPGDVAGNGRVA
jgi:1,2-diacylglycerol 3-beta-glucosyltransferase